MSKLIRLYVVVALGWFAVTLMVPQVPDNAPVDHPSLTSVWPEVSKATAAVTKCIQKIQTATSGRMDAWMQPAVVIFAVWCLGIFIRGLFPKLMKKKPNGTEVIVIDQNTLKALLADRNLVKMIITAVQDPLVSITTAAIDSHLTRKKTGSNGQATAMKSPIPVARAR